MTGGLVGAYATGWVLLGATLLVVGMRSNAGGPRLVVPLALIGATVWPLFVAGAAQWALIAAAIELGHLSRRRPAVATVPARQHIRAVPRIVTAVEPTADRPEPILAGWGIWLGPVLIATARPPKRRADKSVKVRIVRSDRPSVDA